MTEKKEARKPIKMFKWNTKIQTTNIFKRQEKRKRGMKSRKNKLNTNMKMVNIN